MCYIGLLGPVSYVATAKFVLVQVHQRYAASGTWKWTKASNLKISVPDSELSIFMAAVAVALMTLGRGEIAHGEYPEERM